MIRVASRIADYTVRFVDARGLAVHIESLENRVVVVDQRVWVLHKRGCLSLVNESEVILLEAREEEKTLRAAGRLYDALIERSAKRNITLVSIGGGIVQDVTGFVASTLYRGVRWVYAPSTLLAQADSCIGGKTSLNHGTHKNLVGTFYPPSDVLIHVGFLDTLPDIYYYSGLGEVAKLQLLKERPDVAASARLLQRMAAREPEAVRDGVRGALGIKLAYQ